MAAGARIWSNRQVTAASGSLRAAGARRGRGGSTLSGHCSVYVSMLAGCGNSLVHSRIALHGKVWRETMERCQVNAAQLKTSPCPPPPSFPAPLNPPRAVAWPPRARPEHLPPIGKCPAGSKPGPLPTRADFIFVGRACAARGLIDHARYVHVPTSMESLTGYSYPMKCTGAYRGYGHVPPLGGS